MNKVKYSYKSLEDFLISKELSIDYIATDGWGGDYPVKGCEIDASILFADISSFSKKTINLSSTATMFFTNHFFSWITGEALQNVPCIIDKYIGDEIMIIFSNEFGSINHFVDALKVAKVFIENDEWGFCPHIGISSGIVTVGYVGTPKMYNCSVFGKPVALAKRCATIANESMIVFPIINYDKALVDPIFIQKKEIDKNLPQRPDEAWQFFEQKNIELKNIGNYDVFKVQKEELLTFIFDTNEDGSLGDSTTIEQDIKKILRNLEDSGKYRPVKA